MGYTMQPKNKPVNNVANIAIFLAKIATIEPKAVLHTMKFEGSHFIATMETGFTQYAYFNATFKRNKMTDIFAKTSWAGKKKTYFPI